MIEPRGQYTRLAKPEHFSRPKRQCLDLALGFAVISLMGCAIFLSHRGVPTWELGTPIVLGIIVLSARFPEFTVAVLYAGMFFWSLLPESDLITGYRVPITLAWLVASYCLHAFVVDGRRFHFTYTRMDISLLLFSFFIACSLLWSHNQSYGAWKLSLFFSLSVAVTWFLRGFYATRLARLNPLIRAIASMAVLPISIIISVCLEIGGTEGLIPGQFYSERREQFDTLFTVYGASDALMVSGICTIYLILEAKTFMRRLPWGALLLVDLWGLLVLGQRAQFMIILACGMILHWRLKHTTEKLAGSRVLASIVMMTLIGVAVWAQTAFNIRSSLDWVKQDDSLSNRLVAYQIAIQAFGDNPIIGLGVGNYEEYSRTNASKYFGEEGIVGTKLYSQITRSFPHNIFLEVMAEEGLIGLLLWLVAFWTIARQPWVVWKSRDLPFSAIFTLASVWLLARLLICLGAGDLATLSFGPPLAIVSIAGTICAGSNLSPVRHRKSTS